MDAEEFVKPIPDFPTYEVTSFGRVFNAHTGREMSLSPTMHGDLTVGLMKERYQYRRSVKVLVAKAFVEGEDDVFNTPILLDGNRFHLHADNIRWRPRWFAWEYSRQFGRGEPWYFDRQVLDTTNNILYMSIFEAATTNGNLCKDILQSTYDDRRVFPTREIYAFVD